jgi:hypothetical protein
MKQRQPQFTVVSRYASVLLVMSSLFAADVCAQDSRPLKEPLAPSICQLLPAQLNMNEVDAQTLAAPDTQRLQQRSINAHPVKRCVWSDIAIKIIFLPAHCR